LSSRYCSNAPLLAKNVLLSGEAACVTFKSATVKREKIQAL
jgi:hypothetical protein